MFRHQYQAVNGLGSGDIPKGRKRKRLDQKGKYPEGYDMVRTSV
ncbi:MAG: hypothetical protein PVG14_20980 [Anaerolineales bacterium]|jgi:hypothetical protein